MKKIILYFILLFTCTTINAQNSGRGFSYQAVARDAEGEIMVNKEINLQFSLLPSGNDPNPTWSETHSVLTDEYGIFTLIVGQGQKSGGIIDAFKDLDFSKYKYWIKVDIEDGGWKELYKSQLTSVPYAESASNASSIPVGTILTFAGPIDKIPVGWMLCDGSPLNKTEFNSVYQVIGDAWGSSTLDSFNLPDLRGAFLRGVSHGSNRDPEKEERVSIREGGNTKNNVGSWQGDEIEKHRHEGRTSEDGEHTHRVPTNADGGSSGPRAFSANWSRNGLAGIETDLNDPRSRHRHEFRTENYGGAESRPKNAYVNFIIKI